MERPTARFVCGERFSELTSALAGETSVGWVGVRGRTSIGTRRDASVHESSVVFGFEFCFGPTRM